MPIQMNVLAAGVGSPVISSRPARAIKFKPGMST